MKTKNGYNVRFLTGGVGILESKQDKRIITLNRTATTIWNYISGKDFDVEMISSFLLNEYHISQEQANTDAVEFVDVLINNNLIEDASASNIIIN